MKAKHRMFRKLTAAALRSRVRTLLASVTILVVLKIFWSIAVLSGYDPLVSIGTGDVAAQEALNKSTQAPSGDASQEPGTKAASQQAGESRDKSAEFEWSYDLIQDMKEREARLRIKEDQLGKEAERLVALRKEIDGRLEELARIEKRVSELIESKNTVENQQLKKLAKVFEETPPEQAGPLLSKLEVDIAAQLLLKMTGRKAGKIWGYVDPEKAVSISKELARLKPGINMDLMKGK